MLNDTQVSNGIQTVKGLVTEHLLQQPEDTDKIDVEFGIGTRLESAYACYKNGKELECLRHILLALGSICHILGWSKAEAYLNHQNGVLYDMSKTEREAA